jgi:hypothetical protein
MTVTLGGKDSAIVAVGNSGVRGTYGERLTRRPQTSSEPVFACVPTMTGTSDGRSSPDQVADHAAGNRVGCMAPGQSLLAIAH